MKKRPGKKRWRTRGVGRVGEGDEGRGGRVD